MVMPRLSPRLQRVAIMVCALGLAATFAAPGRAEPERAAPGDAVLHLLQERGLVPAKAALDENETLRAVRHKASELVMSAMDFIGVPYKRGGNSAEQGFDCSGFTRHVFEKSLGLILPRRADQQAQADTLFTIRREELKPGDLVFFNTMRRAFSHVGIYIGDGRFIHAPRAGGQVRIEDMREAYWQKRFNGARRADAMAPALLAMPPGAAASAALATTAPIETLR
jgi:cell wall-associated NlpC family hydrolase